ncbi:hypothetical protein E2C01_098216 [Portunus trituberculatus]|uniref:Uncharacterized protein n=1 Tax=Portunus trituberculatus TaxID=210409 RepID=A0A5B7JX90_PORTR|nr:hypothetical protein [Portunus trituberculatus]
MREIIKIAATEGRLHLHECGGAINRRDRAWLRTEWAWSSREAAGRGPGWGAGSKYGAGESVDGKMRSGANSG